MSTIKEAAAKGKPVVWHVIYHYGPGLRFRVGDPSYPSFDKAFAYVWSQIKHHKGGLTKRECRASLAEHWANQIRFPPNGDGYSIDFSVTRVRRKAAAKHQGQGEPV